MNRIATISVAPSRKIQPGSPSIFHRTFFILFLIAFVIVALKTENIFSSPELNGWLDALLVTTAGLTTLVSMARQLPTQNVLLAAGIVAVIGGTVQAIGALSGIPFGPYLYSEAAGPKIFQVLPWSIPIVWIIVLLNARGVSRLMLRPWRKSRLYGFRLIGMTAALALVFDFGLEPYATQVNHFWLWQPTKLSLFWHGTPPTNFLGWLVTSLMMLAFATPVMINKSHQKFLADYHPLIVWLLLNLLFAAGALKHQLWLAAGFILLMGALTAAFSIRGARW